MRTASLSKRSREVGLASHDAGTQRQDLRCPRQLAEPGRLGEKPGRVVAVQLGLLVRIGHPPGELTHGLQQRVAMVVAALDLRHRLRHQPVERIERDLRRTTSPTCSRVAGSNHSAKPELGP